LKRILSAPVLALALSMMIVPLFIGGAHATVGCITSCMLKADTNVPASDGIVYVELDNSSASIYSLPHTFSFANNTRHTLTMLNSTLSVASGARYVWNEWTHSSLQWTPTLMMQTPFMWNNYTGPSDAGAFTALFNKQFQYTLSFKDAAGNPLTPNPTSVTLSSGNSLITTTSYSGQWLSATSWTVTSVTWEGYSGALVNPVPFDLTSASAIVSVAVSAYPASVKVVDKLNNPIQGANVTVTFANATSRTFPTDNQGIVQLGRIPTPAFTLQVFYQGQSQGPPIAESALGSPQTVITLNIGGATSTPVVSAIVLLTIFGIALFLILLAIKVRGTAPPPKI